LDCILVDLAAYKLTVADFNDSSAIIDGEIVSDGEVAGGLVIWTKQEESALVVMRNIILKYSAGARMINIV
jgi:hypothetical protein